MQKKSWIESTLFNLSCINIFIYTVIPVALSLSVACPLYMKVHLFFLVFYLLFALNWVNIFRETVLRLHSFTNFTNICGRVLVLQSDVVSLMCSSRVGKVVTDSYFTDHRDIRAMNKC